MRNKDKIYILFTFFVFFLMISNLDTKIYDRSYLLENPLVYNEITNTKYPILATDDPYQRSDPFYLIDEDFESGLGDWVADESGGGSAGLENKGGGDDALFMRAADGGTTESVIVTYDATMYGFIDGNISFEYDYSNSGLGYDAKCEIRETGGWTPIWDPSSSGTGTFSTDLNAYDTDHSNVNIRFTYQGWTTSTYLMIDNVQLGTYEFNVLEVNGDPIPATQNQVLNIQVCPNFIDWDNDVWIQFKINDTDFSSGAQTILTTYIPIINNFTQAIPESNYTARDIVYYRIMINSTTQATRYSSAFSYSCSDIVGPNIAYVAGNQSEALYHKDVEMSFSIADDADGLGLGIVAMFIANDTVDPDQFDVIIWSNHSVIPLNGGIFNFTIPAMYLSADHTIHYRVYAQDTSTNGAITLDASFNVGDDIKPDISLDNIYAPAMGIENNESLVVSYSITEDVDGSGLDSMYLYVKVANGPNPPSDGTDFNLTPIAPDGGIPDEDGGIFNFTIGEGNYSYGDYVYFFVNATDSATPANTNSSFSDFQTVYVNDTYSPYVVNNSANGNDAAYNISKTLSFTITEPSGASGIKPNSIELSYEVNHWNGAGRGTIVDTLSPTGGVINFAIDENNYTWNDIVYYQLNVSDNALNNYSSIIGSFYVGDPYSPLVTWLSYNNSQPEYTDDFNITFSVTEDLKASQLLSVELFVYNNTGGATPIKIYDFNTTLTGVGGDIIFKINSSITYSRYELSYSLIATDNANNIKNYSDYIVIHDNVNPEVLYQSNNGTGNTFEYDEYAAVYYEINEPIQGSGFNTDGTGLTLYYKNGISSDTSDFDGFVGVYNTSVLDYGGIYMFIIPEGFTQYGWTIEYWVNISDKQGNVKSTWSITNNNIVIIDTTAPIIVMDDGYNEVDHSYHLDKLIRFTPTEFSDSSRLKNATIHWKIDGDPLGGPDGSYTYTPNFTVGGIGGIFYYWTILKTDVIFQYGHFISFRVEVYDLAGNGANSSMNSFTIIDLVDPDYIENPDNTIDYTWRANKTLIFTVFDPNYDNSSGISLIELYFKYKSAPTTGVYHGKLVNSTPSLVLDTYYFIVELNESYFTTEGPNLYYFIRIYDMYGNARNSTVQSFLMHDQAYRLDNIQGPSLFEWLPSGNIFFYIEAHLVTDINVFINGIFHSNYTSNLFNGYIDLTEDYGEGPFGVEFKFVGNVSVKVFNFSVDLYAPSQVEYFTYNLYGTGVVVELLWDQPSGTDAFTVYRIYRSSNKNNIITAENLLIELSEGNLLDELPLGTNSYSDANVEAGTTYYYIIVAVDRVGHVSPASEILTVAIPGNILVYIILFVIIGAVAGISVFLISKRRTTKKREMLFSKVDLKKLDIDDETLISEQVISKKEPQWKKIETKAASKTIIDGFEFSELPFVSVTDTKTYHSNSIGKLISRAAKFEIKGEYGKLVALYSIILRMAKRTSNSLLIMSIESKIEEIYKFLSE